MKTVNLHALTDVEARNQVDNQESRKLLASSSLVISAALQHVQVALNLSYNRVATVNAAQMHNGKNTVNKP